MTTVSLPLLLFVPLTTKRMAAVAVNGPTRRTLNVSSPELPSMVWIVVNVVPSAENCTWTVSPASKLFSSYV